MQFEGLQLSGSPVTLASPPRSSVVEPLLASMREPLAANTSGSDGVGTLNCSSAPVRLPSPMSRGSSSGERHRICSEPMSDAGTGASLNKHSKTPLVRGNVPLLKESVTSVAPPVGPAVGLRASSEDALNSRRVVVLPPNALAKSLALLAGVQHTSSGGADGASAEARDELSLLVFEAVMYPWYSNAADVVGMSLAIAMCTRGWPPAFSVNRHRYSLPPEKSTPCSCSTVSPAVGPSNGPSLKPSSSNLVAFSAGSVAFCQYHRLKKGSRAVPYTERLSPPKVYCCPFSVTCTVANGVPSRIGVTQRISFGRFADHDALTIVCDAKGPLDGLARESIGGGRKVKLALPSRTGAPNCWPLGDSRSARLSSVKKVTLST
eukprot:7378585-Prymnesium_polylepis.2